MVPVYGVMALAPHSKLARVIATTPVLPLALAAAYLFLLSQAWAAGLGECMRGIAASMQVGCAHNLTSSSLWAFKMGSSEVHLLPAPLKPISWFVPGICGAVGAVTIPVSY